jgi:DNA-binding GntR family transcriptional regulator
MSSAEDSDKQAAQHGLMSHRVTEELRQRILSGAFKPGSKIGQEELAEHFGTSRIPVREALRRLENEGLVVLVPNSGAWVAKLDLSECVELYKMRERIEPLAMRESVLKMTDEQIARIENLIWRVEQSKDAEEFLHRDREFHLACYSPAAMPRLVAMTENFWNTTQHYRRAFVGLFGPEGDAITQYEHRLLVAAMKRRDADDAERILFGHIRRTRLELERHQEQVFQSDAEADKRKTRRKRKARKPTH